MSENVTVDLSGQMDATVEKKGLQKYVNNMELLIQHIRSGAGPALIMGVLATRRPWTQFVATENFKFKGCGSRHVREYEANNLVQEYQLLPNSNGTICVQFEAPASLPRLSRRVYRNVEHFQANYLMVFLGLFAYCLITSPLLLIAMVGSFFGFKKLTSGPNTWKIGGWELTKTQQYAVAAAGSMALCWLAGAGAVLFWVLGATVTVIALHASFFDAEALPPSEDPEQFPMIEQV